MLRCGILVVGSLYWGVDGGRDRWRQWRLDTANVIRAPVPIRYGRKSLSNTYTMVFARLAEHQLGQGAIIRRQREIRSPDDLIMEARWLWAAETKRGVPDDANGIPPSELSSTWGQVAIILRPGRQISRELLAALADQFSGHDDASLLVNDQGLLDIAWPTTADTAGFDLLLATTNRPTPGNLSAQAVADAWNRHPKERYYFEENQRAGILTFQDAEIRRLLR